MSEAPSPVDDRQLAELDIRVIEKPAGKPIVERKLADHGDR
jgi:hypothetical protein